MNNLKTLISILAFCSYINSAYSQTPTLEQPGAKVLKFKSAINNHDYVLYIQLPEDYSNSAKRYPVVYALDGQWQFPLISGLRNGMYTDGFIPQLIIVGITWPDDFIGNRDRDFLPTPVNEFKNSDGASEFLKVIKNEITTKIDSTYRTDKKNNILYGDSSGGLFTLYTLFHEPGLFNSYIALSPPLWYDNQLIFKYEKEFAEKKPDLSIKLFIAFGGYEVEMNPGMFDKFYDQLKVSKYRGLEIEKLVVDKTGHQTMVPYAAQRGMQYVFSKPDLIIDGLILDKYVGNYEQGIIITRTGNSLYINRIKMHAMSNVTFYLLGAPGTGEFIKDDKGKITGYSVKQEKEIFFAKKLD
jgi:predicted alpha/beta superfamily hydrolase